MSKTDYDYLAYLYFHDECPRLGSGWRSVMVKERGERSTLIEVGSGRRASIKTNTLDLIEQQCEDYWQRAGKAA